MAGDFNHAKQVIKKYFKSSPSCATIRKEEYIYYGGQEQGFIIRFVNYPRFPKSRGELEELAKDVAFLLVSELGEDSFLLITPDFTHWISDRDTD